jgi:2-dehydro-3-deoxyphosphooctonate aldolase (KDO 8-P synthase)
MVTSSLKRPIIIAGPCVIESKDILDTIAQHIANISQRNDVKIIFKASFDKANRTSIESYRGVGIDRGVEMLADIKSRYGLSITTDIHEAWQAEVVAPVADVIQIPALLCRQTDLIVAAARTGNIVNIKKGQFLSARDMLHAYNKAASSGAREVWLTERGNTFGYNNLVVDFRNIPQMREFADRVIMDCTHTVQLPNIDSGRSGGEREYIPAMALAAKAFGAEGYFFEVHPSPDVAMCDGKNSLKLDELEDIIKIIVR